MLARWLAAGTFQDPIVIRVRLRWMVGRVCHRLVEVALLWLVGAAGCP